jgi:hypothetical protein
MSRRLRVRGELLADLPVDVALIIALQGLALNRGRLHDVVRQGSARP